MDELLEIKKPLDETVNSYLTRADGDLAHLDSAKHSYLKKKIVRAMAGVMEGGNVSPD